MAFQIQRGLFTSDFSDCYAILGVPVDVDPKDIRKGYLKIARRLHPDSSSLSSDSDRQLASQLLSKLVNPAWEKLSQEKNRTDYNVLVKMKGQSASRDRSQSISVGSIAQQLLTANNPDFYYRTAVTDLANKQFEHLDQSIDIIGQLSELNLVYLVRKEESGEYTISSTRPLYTVGARVTDVPPAARDTASINRATAANPYNREPMGEPYLRRAEGYFKKGDYVQTIRELRDGLAIDPKHGRCHSLLGMAYLNQKQPTMAKIHFNKALEIDPEDEQAQIGKQAVERATAASTAAKAPPKPSGPFGGLFNRKK
jgi:curved DNA-binding protein CbpA